MDVRLAVLPVNGLPGQTRRQPFPDQRRAFANRLSLWEQPRLNLKVPASITPAGCFATRRSALSLFYEYQLEGCQP